MAKLASGQQESKGAGTYNIQVSIGTGTALLQYSTDGLSFVTIPDTSVSASTGLTLDLPSCAVKATLTGDAQMSINQVRR
jgi:hypothetical protein